MSRVRERPSTSEAHNDFWCGMSGVHAGGDAKLLIKFAWPYGNRKKVKHIKLTALIISTISTRLYTEGGWGSCEIW